MRPNTKQTVIPLSSREPGTVEKTISAGNARGILVTVYAEGTNGDGTQDLQVAVKAPISDASEATTLISDEFTDGATGLRQYLIYPGVSDTQGVYDAVQATPTPQNLTLEVSVTSGGADPSYTYSAATEMLVE